MRGDNFIAGTMNGIDIEDGLNLQVHPLELPNGRRALTMVLRRKLGIPAPRSQWLFVGAFTLNVLAINRYYNSMAQWRSGGQLPCLLEIFWKSWKFLKLL